MTDALPDYAGALLTIESGNRCKSPQSKDNNSMQTSEEDRALDIENGRAEAEMKRDDLCWGRKTYIIRDGHYYSRSEKGHSGQHIELEETCPAVHSPDADADADLRMESNRGQLGRLNHYEEWSNHTRESPGNQLHDPNDKDELLPSSSGNTTKKRARPCPRHRSQDPGEEQCAKRRRVLLLDVLGLGPLDHEAAKMRRKSPRKKKRHEHSTDYPASASNRRATGSARAHSKPPGSPVAVIDDSEDSHGNDGEVLSAKRISLNTAKNSSGTSTSTSKNNHRTSSPYSRQKAQEGATSPSTGYYQARQTKPNAEQKLVQHNSEVELSDSSGLTYKDRTDASLLPHAEDGQTNRGGKGGVQRLQEPSEALSSQRSSWIFANRYPYGRSSRQDNHSSQRSISTLKPPHGEKPAMRPQLPGGLRPVNTLNSKATVENSRQLAATPFNLHKNHPKPQENSSRPPPAKRQRVDDKWVGNNASPTRTIDLDPESPSSQTNHETSTIRSSQSRDRQPQRRGIASGNNGGVSEYKNVESLVNPSRSLLQKDGPRNVTNVRRRPLTVVSLGRASPGEDQFDPIVDEEILKNSTPVVEVPQYKGNAYHRPPRRATGRQLSNSISPSLRSRENSAEGHRTLGSHKARHRDINPSLPNKDDKYSTDDLAVDHYGKLGDVANKKKANKLLAKRNKKRRRAGQDCVAEEVSSEGGITDTAADIKSTKFGKETPTQTSPGTTYSLKQVFCPNHEWLIDPSATPWVLDHKKREGEDGPKRDSLEIIDRDKCSQLCFPTKTISRIEFCDETAHIILLRPLDLRSSPGPSHILLELRGSGESSNLRRQLLDRDPRLQLINKSSEYMDKRFTRARKALIDAKSARVPVPEEPEDIKHLKAQRKQRQNMAEAEESNRRDIAHNATNGKQSDTANKLLRAEGLAKSMKTTSADSSADSDGRKSKGNGIPPGTFYGSVQHPELSPEPSSRAIRTSRRLAGKYTFQQQPRSQSNSPTGLTQRRQIERKWTKMNPGWANEWHGTLTYPREGRNRANVDLRDIERLDEEEFLNDSLVNFYIRWLEYGLEKSRPDLAKRIYFQNSYFYERLTAPLKGKRGINYEAVKRWTSKVDLFEKDYIVVPVCENMHWYVAIICNAPKLLNPETEAVAKAGPVSPSKDVDSEIANGMLEDQHTETSVPLKAISSPHASNVVLTSKVNDDMESMSLDSRHRADSEHSWPDELLNQGVSTPRFSKQSSPIPIDDGATKHITKSSDGLPVVGDAPSNQPRWVKTLGLGRKGKRASMGRKYDPNEPHIITLDSLGATHSPTCTNLRDYLLAELKAKHGKDVPNPKPLGKTAKNIPEQSNWSDCGLFLLSYVEKFLEMPDNFVRDILQNQHDVDIEWPKASQMRDRIRDLLFRLQKEQFSESERTQKPEGEVKSTGNPSDATDDVSPASSIILRAPEAAQASEQDGEFNLGKAQDVLEPSTSSGPRPSIEETPVSSLKGVLLKDRNERKADTKQSLVSNPKLTPGANQLLSYMSNPAARDGSCEEEGYGKSGVPNSGGSKLDVVEIGDSPIKPNHARHHAKNDLEMSDPPSETIDFREEEGEKPSNDRNSADSIIEIPSQDSNAEATTRLPDIPSSPDLIDPNMEQSSQQHPKLSSPGTIKGSETDDIDMLLSRCHGLPRDDDQILPSLVPSSPIREQHHLRRKTRSKPSSPVAKLKRSPRITKGFFAGSRDSSDSAVVGRKGTHHIFRD